VEYLYHPDRLKYPLKRTGQRGECQWQQISWDEAFGFTAEALNKVKQEQGPEGVVMMHGSAKGYMDTHLVRLANAFGTPNVVVADHVCHVPRMLAEEITFGFFSAPEYNYPPACIVVWGFNLAETRFVLNNALVQAVNNGSKLIVIDPIEKGLAKKADLWLQVRPGSDLALALGMINVIVKEGLYDKDFVENWTTGFDELKANIQNYSPERVAEITWVPAELISKAARLYATNKPAHIETGNAFDHSINSFQAGRAISILKAITGNLGIPGGEIETPDSEFRYDTPQQSNWLLGRWSSQLELRDEIPREKRRNKVGTDLGMLPDYRYVLPQSVIKSILNEDPYRISAAYVQASNPLSSWPNIQKAYQAFKKLDFLAVTDMFMTPTAALADIVFPVASCFEYDGIATPPHGKLARVQRKVAQIGECHSDHEIINGLAKKLGLEEYFWDSINDFWDTVLSPIGMTYEEFKRRDWLTGNEDDPQPKQYKMYEKNGFRTPSGKVELYSSRLESWGLAPLPIYYEPLETSQCSQEMAEEYPLLCTNHKLSVYRHSGGRQIPSLRDSHPDPIVIIHPDTAGKLGIKDRDWVYIENKQGKIRQRANLSTIVDRRIVVLDHAWWFPERGETVLFDYADSNCNTLTSDEPPFSPEIGSFLVRGLPCKVYKAL
jgi:anaerobic selenocysteine-containing dehydrogenase